MAERLNCDDPRIRHVRVAGDGCDLHVAEYGDGPAVLLLHGFPDFWMSWRAQAVALAEAGYRCVMPDMRGYGGSDAPDDVAAYNLDRLVADAAAVIEQRCDGECTVVGHDWGGVVAWQLAAAEPDLLRWLVILNAPHPAAYRRALLTSPQVLRSWYAAAVQVPALPERILGARGGAPLVRLLRRAGLSEEDAACYRQAFDGADALRGPLNYYRAAARQMLRHSSEHERVDVPTAVIWGEDDPWLDEANLTHLPEYVRDLQVERVGGAGHFVHWEQPDRVSALLLDVLRQDRVVAEQAARQHVSPGSARKADTRKAAKTAAPRQAAVEQAAPKKAAPKKRAQKKAAEKASSTKASRRTAAAKDTRKRRTA